MQAYQEATRLNPRMPDAHLNLANAYLDKGQYGQAVVHYRMALDIRPNWEKAENGLAQAEAGQEASRVSAGRAAVATQVRATPTTVDTVAAGAHCDPDRTVDPDHHGAQLTMLHRSTIETENHGRNCLQILEKQVEPAIKELSSCLLYPDSAAGELDECVKKLENAMQSMQNAQRSLETSMEQIRTLGEKLVKS